MNKIKEIWIEKKVSPTANVLAQQEEYCASTVSSTAPGQHGATPSATGRWLPVVTGCYGRQPVVAATPVNAGGYRWLRYGRLPVVCWLSPVVAIACYGRLPFERVFGPLEVVKDEDTCSSTTSKVAVSDRFLCERMLFWRGGAPP